MKKKAIAELEFLPFLQNVLAKKHNDPDLIVEKYGSDAELWFHPKAISRDPDYRAKWNSGNNSFLYEFQYAEQTKKLKYFDFKVSKVGKKRQEKRTPHRDREFFYVCKPEKQYTFVSPKWIMENGQEGTVHAWGDRRACRVPRETFMSQLRDGGADIVKVIDIVDCKNILLNFQHDFLDLESEKLSHQLQQVVDKKKLMEIIPHSFKGFYEVCYLLDNLKKAPRTPAVWLVYLTSFFGQINSAMDLAKFMFSLDFLYFKCESLHDNEEKAVVEILRKAQTFIREFPVEKGLYAKNPKEPPLEETRQILFSANLLEDLIQHTAVHSQYPMERIQKIYQSIEHFSEIAAEIQKAESQ